MLSHEQHQTIACVTFFHFTFYTGSFIAKLFELLSLYANQSSNEDIHLIAF